MGFTVTDQLNFPKFGVNVAGCYVTIKGSYSIIKFGSGAPIMYMAPAQNSETPYTLTARWLIYASNDVTLQPLREEIHSVSYAQIPANCYEAIYNSIKNQHFAGKTCTDDL